MIIIKDKKHISTIIESLNKIYKKVKITGKLEIMELYYLNLIKKLLDNDYLTLTNDQNNLLVSLYNKLIYKSEQICTPIIYKSYQTTPIKHFTQAEVKDCNNFDSKKRIFYWQEEYDVTNIDIQNNLDFDYLDDKSYDTYENFEIGVDVPCSKIGLISFFTLDNLSTDTFIIKDSLNNNITHTFTSTYNNDLKGWLFTTQNIYSHGNINFKIIKQ